MLTTAASQASPRQRGYWAQIRDSVAQKLTLDQLAEAQLRAYGWAPCNECNVPTISVTNLAGFGNGGPTLFVQNNYEWRDSLTWNKGSHSFKAGFDLFKLQSNFDPTRGYQRPGFTFSSTQAVFMMRSGVTLDIF